MKKGFTLIEMLVVIAIIALLASLTVPGVQKGILRSQQVQSMNNLRQLVAANLNYAVNHGHYVPADDRWNRARWHGARSAPGAPFDPAEGFLADYLGKSRQVTQCPRFHSMLKGKQSFEDGTGGYGYNSSYVGGWPGRGYGPDGRRVSARTTQIVNMRTVMFATSGYASGSSIQEYAFSEPPFWDFGSGPVTQRPSPSTHFRFNNRALIGWMDGSVTAEAMEARSVGSNPHGGNADAQLLGWFGPDAYNGFWNPQRP